MAAAPQEADGGLIDAVALGARIAGFSGRHLHQIESIELLLLGQPAKPNREQTSSSAPSSVMPAQQTVSSRALLGCGKALTRMRMRSARCLLNAMEGHAQVLDGDF